MAGNIVPPLGGLDSDLLRRELLPEDFGVLARELWPVEVDVEVERF
jgi:hypothetical protein